MSVEQNLLDRSDSSCELCKSKHELTVLLVSPKSKETNEHCALVCNTCKTQIQDGEQLDQNHWRCLNESMWSQVPSVQVLSWRMLNQLKGEDWARDLLEMMYLDEETEEWAKTDNTADEKVIHLDSNGAVLQAGDSVVLIKDLNVKGASFVAKRGTAVRRISLVHDNPEHIEGKVDGQHIVILTKFVKKK